MNTHISVFPGSREQPNPGDRLCPGFGPTSLEVLRLTGSAYYSSQVCPFSTFIHATKKTVPGVEVIMEVIRRINPAEVKENIHMVTRRKINTFPDHEKFAHTTRSLERF
jgi:hypothetical protein